jgi:N-acetylated-alpha-linked acidic dipeptidase
MYQRTPQFAPVRQPWLAVAAGLLALAAAFAAAAGESAAFGFSPAQFPRQQALEQRFDAELNPTDLRAWLQRLSSEANHVGSPHDKANAEFIRDLLRQWGWDAQIEVFEVLYPTLTAHSLELVAPVKFTASLREPAIEGDATSTRTDGLAPYNEYGADADVTGQLVYLNYGMPADYKELARHGVDVRGKIVIT